MKIDMPYGKTSVTLTIPEKLEYIIVDNSVFSGDKSALPGVKDTYGEELVKAALLNPVFGSSVDYNDSLGSIASFGSFFKSGDTVALIISDYTRATGSEVYTPIIISMLKAIGIKLKNITIVIALGLHRPASAGEMVKLVTEDVYKRVKVINHNPYSGLKQVGKVNINRTVAEASKVVVTGSVTFHPMAGFSGGYKSIIPGVASAEDILTNHKLYFEGLNPSPLIEPGKTENNPILHDIIERSKELKNTYCLNVVLNKEKKIVFAASGDVLYSWGACSEYLKKNYTIPLKKKYPLVIASAGGYPSDFSFYQSMKVLTNSARACQENGVLVVLSQCSEGWEISSEYLQLFRLPLPELTRELFNNFNIEKLAVLMALRIIKKHRIFFYSSLSGNELQNIGIIPVKNKNDLLKIISQAAGRKETAFIKRASYFLPQIKEV